VKQGHHLTPRGIDRRGDFGLLKECHTSERKALPCFSHEQRA
jgi:hypothetical protein